MATWNKPRQQDDLEDCPICLVKVTRRRKSAHIFACVEAYKDHMEEMGLIICPLYSNHIIPRKYLNHHLEGNCTAAANAIRRCVQLNLNLDKLEDAPDDFMPKLSQEILNDENRKLLYYLMHKCAQDST